MGIGMFSQIKKDAEGKNYLTDAQVTLIVKKIIEVFNFPFLNNAIVEIVFAKIVKQIDEVLYKNLPNEIYNFINSVELGFAEGDLDSIKRRLIEIVNKVINIPFLNEDDEAKLIEFILTIIVNAMGLGKSL